MPLKFMMFFFAILLAGCENNPYTITLNNNVLYSPTERVQTTHVEDANLQGCINQYFLRNNHEDAEKITILACPSAGIETLAGIRNLPNLEQVDFSDNRITDVSALNALDNLRVLSIRNNDIRNTNPLLDMPLLRFVAMQGNDNIPCRQLDRLAEKIGNTLNRPLNCK